MSLILFDMPDQPDSLPFQSADDKPRFRAIDRDWFGAELTCQPSFRIVIGPESLSLLAIVRKSPISTPGASAGSFYEGLWENDVAELFLLNPDNGHYLELHAAPNGAWWSCLFEEPRVRAEVCNDPLPGGFGEGLEGVNHWEAKVTVPLAGLPAALAFDPARTLGNVCFCLGSEPHQVYATHAFLGTGRPNFHQPQFWLPLKRDTAG